MPVVVPVRHCGRKIAPLFKQLIGRPGAPSEAAAGQTSRLGRDAGRRGAASCHPPLLKRSQTAWLRRGAPGRRILSPSGLAARRPLPAPSGGGGQMRAAARTQEGLQGAAGGRMEASGGRRRVAACAVPRRRGRAAAPPARRRMFDAAPGRQAATGATDFGIAPSCQIPDRRLTRRGRIPSCGLPFLAGRSGVPDSRFDKQRRQIL